MTGEYVDNDISAYSGKSRPGYERMLVDIADGRVDAVLVYHLDRLTRRRVELEHFIDVCASARVDVTTVTGDIGLGNDNGLMIARITSAMAAAESGRKSARIKRKLLQDAQMGKPHAGGPRPYGYENDKVTIRDAEAHVIREAAFRYIAGESMNSLARWLNRAGIPTPGDAASWQVQTLRPILTRGRIAGIREHNGKEMGPAVWPAIIGPGERSRAEYVAARKVAAGRHSDALRELDRATGTNLMDGIETGQTALRRSWERLDLTRQRAIVRTLLDHAVIHERPRGARKLD